jgi:hypothetical protein
MDSLASWQTRLSACGPGSMMSTCTPRSTASSMSCWKHSSGTKYAVIMRIRSCADSSMTRKTVAMSFQPTVALPRDLHARTALGPLVLGEAAGALDQVVAGLGPVLREGRRQPVDRRAGHPDVRVAPLVLVAGVAAPLLGDADAAGEADDLVAHEDLAVRAVVVLERREQLALPDGVRNHSTCTPAEDIAPAGRSP